MKPNIIKQIIGYTVSGPLDRAEKYYTIMSTLNDLHLEKREVQLMAFTAVKGNIWSKASREEFVKEYKSSLATVGNIITKLSKRHLLKKESKKVFVNKALLLDFNNTLILNINLVNDDKDRGEAS